MDGSKLDDLVTSRRALLLGLAALTAVPLVGCGRGGAEIPALLVADGVERNQPPADAPVAAAVDGLTTFGHRIFEAAAKPGANFIASPLSLAVAFAMLRAGAVGATASELDSAFGFPASGRDAAFNAITRQLVTTDVPPAPDRRPREADGKPKPPVVSIGNALFPQKGLAIGAPFLRTLAAEYGAGVRPVDFAAADALKLINAWADQQTAGRIKKIFEDLNSNTKLVLANAVYFKADWQTYFMYVSPEPFTKASGAVIQAPTMRHTGQVRYADVNGMTAIELPYSGGEYAMWIILPKAGSKPEDALTAATMGPLRGSFAAASAEIAVPKWDFETSLDLTTLLPDLGLPTAFGSGADFSGIASGLFVSQAVHKANISVDEWGTEAAAVTGIGMATSGPPTPTVRFIADRPFAFVIVGGGDRIPLFVGRVSDPTAK